MFGCEQKTGKTDQYKDTITGKITVCVHKHMQNVLQTCLQAS